MTRRTTAEEAPERAPAVDLAPNLADAEVARVLPAAGHPHLLRSLMTGAGGLGLALGIERGGGFLASVLAARLGGAQVFGAYSIALAAANNVAWYVGAGVGDTATRFVAEYTPGTRAYRHVVRSLLMIAAVSAVIAAVVLFAGAEPMARIFLRNAGLSEALKVAAFSAAAFVALECVRGLFIGTRSFGRLLLLSSVVGVGLFLVIPYAAVLGPSYMLGRQSAVVFLAVIISVVLILKQPLAPARAAVRELESPALSRIWKFGLMQLGGVVGINAAGWWTASLVARWDVSLLQVAFYAVATQLRNVSSLIPGLVQHSNFAFFTDEGGRAFGGADHVVSVSSFASSALATVCSGLAIVALPWVLRHFYGHDYVNAEFAAVLAVATLLVHLGVAPAASRLLIVSPLASGLVNAFWAVFVVVIGMLTIPRGGAKAATAVLFTAHMLSTFLVLGTLRYLHCLPTGVTMLAFLDTGTAAASILLASLRMIYPHYAVGLSLLLLGFSTAMTWILFRLGQQYGAFPKVLDFAWLLQGFRMKVPATQ